MKINEDRRITVMICEKNTFSDIINYQSSTEEQDLFILKPNPNLILSN